MTTTDRSALALRVDVLGPLELHVAGRPVPLPGQRRRALLALLALEAGRVASADRLVDALWPEEPPDNALAALYSHVSRLRGHLGPLADRLRRDGGGYRLLLQPDELDVDTARRLAAAATTASAGVVDPVEAAAAALALWRGPALAEFADLPALEAASVGLAELRLELVDVHLEARLARADRGVAADAADAAAQSPLRERTALLHVRALAADGRGAEAMAAAQAFRRRLSRETGLDPGPALAELEQLVAAGAAAYPSSGVPPLPAPVLDAPVRARPVARPDGPLVGRRHDRDEVIRLVGSQGAVTLTGPGGVGKTRLALEVAAALSSGLATVPDGAPLDVVVVDLAAVDRDARVLPAVSTTLELRTRGAVGASDVAAALAGRSLLLLLDNCEHVLDACRDLVVTLRRQAPGVRVLATSRATLHVPGEHVVRLQPLPVPRRSAELEDLRRQPAVRAFLEHARRLNPAYDLAEHEAADLVEVLGVLDGLPLGIELAARQVGVVPLRAVRERLDRALDLASGRPAADEDRQRTLRATIDSSYRLLSDDEQRLLRATAVFPGGVSLATVEALVASLGIGRDPLDLLHRLVDASLVVADPAAGRYRLLFTVRAFLLEELRRSGELVAAEERFLDRCLELVRELGRELVGPDEPVADGTLRAERDNLRAARDTAVAHGRDDVRVAITVDLADPAAWRDLHEFWAWALELAVDPRLADHPQRPAVLGSAAESARLLGDLDRAARLAEEAFVVAGPDPDAALVYGAWAARASVAHFRGDFRRARDQWLESRHGRSSSSGIFLGSAALAAAYAGDRDDARALLDETHAANARSGCRSHLAFAAYVEGELLAREHPRDAVTSYREAIDGAHRCGAGFVEGVARVALASALTRTGQVREAAETFGHLLGYWTRTRQATQLWTTARNAAALLASAGHARTAALLLICADAEPAAAAVNPAIARHSGRAYLPPEQVVDAADLPALREEAARRGAVAVLEEARNALAELASG